LTSFRPKLWTGVSAAIVLSASLTACGDKADNEVANAANAPAPAVGEGGEGGAEGGAAAGGEAGAQAAYVSVPADSRVALRLAHLKGFFLIAQKQTEGADAAAALAGQGMLEVFDVQPGAFKAAGLDEAQMRKWASSGSAADLKAAIAAIDEAQAKAGGDQAAVAKGMLSIATGLYKNVISADGVDATEYQHSMGAILSAQQALDAAVKTKPALSSAKGEMATLVRMWPATEAPKAPTPAAQVDGQAARVELAIS
jgi:hypothetical protein